MFREVFEYLINDFKTYQNLLAAIKQEYELVLRDQEERLKELDPLRVCSIKLTLRCSLLDCFRDIIADNC